MSVHVSIIYMEDTGIRFLGLKLQAVVSLLMWVLGAKLLNLGPLQE